MGRRPATGKLSNSQYKGYLLKRKKSHRGLLQNFEAVVQSENAVQVEEYRGAVVRMLASRVCPSGPLVTRAVDP